MLRSEGCGLEQLHIKVVKCCLTNAGMLQCAWPKVQRSGPVFVKLGAARFVDSKSDSMSMQFCEEEAVLSLLSILASAGSWPCFAYRVYACTPPKGKKKELQYYFLIFIVFTADVGTVFTADVRETFDCYRFYRDFWPSVPLM